MLDYSVSSSQTDEILLSSLTALYGNKFISDNIHSDIDGVLRPSVENWNVGAVQLLSDPNSEDNSDEGDTGSDNEVVVNPPTNVDNNVHDSQPSLDQSYDLEAIRKAQEQVEALVRAAKLRLEAEIKAAEELAAKKREMKAALKAKRKAELEKRKLATELIRARIYSRRGIENYGDNKSFPNIFIKARLNMNTLRPI